MKKKYIQPTVSVSFVVVESQLLAGGSGPGAQKDRMMILSHSLNSTTSLTTVLTTQLGLRINHPGTDD